MTIGLGEPHAYAGGVASDVCVDEDVIGTAANAGTPGRTFRLDVTDEWAIDEYMLQDRFDFNAVTVADAQAAIRTLVANRHELWDSYGNPADSRRNPAG